MLNKVESKALGPRAGRRRRGRAGPWQRENKSISILRRALIIEGANRRPFHTQRYVPGFYDPASALALGGSFRSLANSPFGHSLLPLSSGTPALVPAVPPSGPAALRICVCEVGGAVFARSLCSRSCSRPSRTPARHVAPRVYFCAGWRGRSRSSRPSWPSPSSSSRPCSVPSGLRSALRRPPLRRSSWRRRWSPTRRSIWCRHAPCRTAAAVAMAAAVPSASQTGCSS